MIHAHGTYVYVEENSCFNKNGLKIGDIIACISYSPSCKYIIKNKNGIKFTYNDIDGIFNYIISINEYRQRQIDKILNL